MSSRIRGNRSSYSYTPPYEHLVECNGQTLVGDEYADLIKALGTNVVPNLNGEGRFLQGSNTAGNKVDAGLPNITGNVSGIGFKSGVSDCIDFSNSSATGAFTTSATSANSWAAIYSATESSGGRKNSFNIDASRSNSIYGKSSTVQPPAYTVKYYICYGE